jgi:hypothetical protein
MDFKNFEILENNELLEKWVKINGIKSTMRYGNRFDYWFTGNGGIEIDGNQISVLKN